jgi:hypothetical protein
MLAQADIRGPPAELGAARNVEDTHPILRLPGITVTRQSLHRAFQAQVKREDRPMPLLIGSATVAATLLSMAFGQINAGFEAFGVLLAAVVLMTLRAE